MTQTAPAARRTCGGNFVITIAAVEPGEFVTVDCSGCLDCDRETVRARMAAAGRFDRDPFALLPAPDDGWRF